MPVAGCLSYIGSEVVVSSIGAEVGLLLFARF